MLKIRKHITCIYESFEHLYQGGKWWSNLQHAMLSQQSIHFFPKAQHLFDPLRYLKKYMRNLVEIALYSILKTYKLISRHNFLLFF